jgi:hypothetical protein
MAALNERPRTMVEARAADEPSIRLFDTVDHSVGAKGTVAQ